MVAEKARKKWTRKTKVILLKLEEINIGPTCCQLVDGGRKGQEKVDEEDKSDFTKDRIE
jgi:hypothetical protein